MSAAQPPRFDDFARKVDAAVGTVRQRLEESGITIADSSNRRPHYDPLRSVCYTFVKSDSVDNEQQKVAVSIFILEPAAEGDELTVTVTTKAERFWVGNPSHWESSQIRSLTPGELLESNLPVMVRRLISDGQADILRST